MADTIERLEVLIEANTKSFENAMKKLTGVTNAGLKPIGEGAKAASVQMENLAKGAEFLGKIFGVGLAAREIRKNFGEIAKVIHETADGTDDLGGRITASMI